MTTNDGEVLIDNDAPTTVDGDISIEVSSADTLELPLGRQWYILELTRNSQPVWLLNGWVNVKSGYGE
jgi:hypothetical protein